MSAPIRVRLMMENKMNEELKIGRMAILEFMREQFNQDSFCWKTVQRWKKTGMPFHRMRNGRPFIKISEIITWQLKNK